jgi:ABC-type glycerol-3-phosphate transport system substrate-binding protein
MANGKFEVSGVKYLMKNGLYAVLLVIITLLLAACSGSQEEVDVKDLLAGGLQGEITVSCFDTMLYGAFLNEAAALFESVHPGTKINVEFFSSMPEIKTMELEDGSMVSVSEGNDQQEAFDYVRRLNTQLMGGQGPDVLAMDVLPYYKYAESGRLEDLRFFMEADEGFIASAYRENIIEAVRYKGGQYIMPLDFSCFFISFDSEKVGAGAATKLREKNAFTYGELCGLIKDQFAADNSGARAIDFQGGATQALRLQFTGADKKYVDLENKKANFTDGSFVELLNKINEQRQNGYFRPEFLSMEENTQDFIESQPLYYYQYQTDIMLKSIFMPKEDTTYPGSFPIPDIDEIAGRLTNEAGKADFHCLQSYGINANSKNKALAWAFIKFMLSGAMQGSLNLYGFPVNNAAFIEDAKLYITKIPNYVSQASGEYTVDGYHELTEEKYQRAYEGYLEYINELASMLNLYPVTDMTIDEMVSSEVELFLSGKKSAEMVADTLQNKVQLYLNE